MRTKIPMLIAGFALMTLAACTSVPTASDIPANIANASTAPDHERIAEYFAQKAVAYDAEAALHKKMSISYANRPKGEPAAMMAHCRALETQFTSAAKEVRALEQAHRILARELSK